MDGHDHDYQDLIDEALADLLTGWNFTSLNRRAPMIQPLPWNYPQVVTAMAAGCSRMLHMGMTGRRVARNTARRRLRRR